VINRHLSRTEMRWWSNPFTLDDGRRGLCQIGFRLDGDTVVAEVIAWDFHNPALPRHVRRVRFSLAYPAARLLGYLECYEIAREILPEEPPLLVRNHWCGCQSFGGKWSTLCGRQRHARRNTDW
jgi:hypothetical protein